MELARSRWVRHKGAVLPLRFPLFRLVGLLAALGALLSSSLVHAQAPASSSTSPTSTGAQLSAPSGAQVSSSGAASSAQGAPSSRSATELSFSSSQDSFGPALHEDSPYQPPPSTRWPVILSGVGLSATFYTAGLVTSYAIPHDPGVKDLQIPLVGPWMALHDNACIGTCDGFYYARLIWSIVDGIGQAAGLPLILQGILMPTQVYHPAPSSGTDSKSKGPELDPDSDQQPDAPKPNKDLYWLPRPTPIGMRGFGFFIGGAF